MIYDDKKFIGSVIRNARNKAKISQAELSEKIGMCDKNLGNIENGKQFPQVNNFLRIIEILNLSLDNFGVSTKVQEKKDIDVILKKLLCSSPTKIDLYTKALDFVDSISK